MLKLEVSKAMTAERNDTICLSFKQSNKDFTRAEEATPLVRRPAKQQGDVVLDAMQCNVVQIIFSDTKEMTRTRPSIFSVFISVYRT